MSSKFHEIPNPPPEKSQLPDSLLKLAINLDDAKKSVLSDNELAAIKAYRRAANYIAAAMIFLKENTMLERKVMKTDIKPRLLGHWGTCTSPNWVCINSFRPWTRVSLCTLQSVD
jgi:xylulose-5-phosphate/fructose-6-phosphate phosphoketolase